MVHVEPPRELGPQITSAELLIFLFVTLVLFKHQLCPVVGGELDTHLECHLKSGSSA